MQSIAPSVVAPGHGTWSRGDTFACLRGTANTDGSVGAQFSWLKALGPLLARAGGALRETVGSPRSPATQGAGSRPAVGATPARRFPPRCRRLLPTAKRGACGARGDFQAIRRPARDRSAPPAHLGAKAVAIAVRERIPYRFNFTPRSKSSLEPLASDPRQERPTSPLRTLVSASGFPP